VTAGDLELDLDDERRAGLAGALEAAQRTLTAVRYGSVFRIGVADVVLNPDDPLPSAGLATGLAGAPGRVEGTLHALPAVWAEAGLAEVRLSVSPSCASELELLAEESGYEAVEETTTMLLTRPARLAEGEPGRITQVLRDADEDRIGPFLAQAHDWSPQVGRRLQRLMGHRLDDPRHVTMAAYDLTGEGVELAGVATGFLHVTGAGGRGAARALGQLVDVAVRPRSRRRGLGRALGSAVTAALLSRGADLVWLGVEAGGRDERFCAGLGFESAYDAVTYVRPVQQPPSAE
jgi:GNAT superfamily N-acetyltransferase